MPDIDLDAIEARIAAVNEPLHAEARMSAYYYGFNRTGVGVIDAVLSAVAVAGKGAHHTEDWNDVSDYGYYDERPGLPANPPGFDKTIGSNGGSAITLIQRTANVSAETVRGMSTDLAALVGEVRTLRAVADWTASALDAIGPHDDAQLDHEFLVQGHAALDAWRA